MAPEFKLETEAQKQRFLDMLTRDVAKDQQDAKRMLEENPDKLRDLPPTVLQVLKDNVAMKKAVADKLVSDMQGKKVPISFEAFVYQYTSSFHSADIAQPQKAEYSAIVSNMLSTEAPPEMLHQTNDALPKGFHAHLISIKPEDLTPEKLKVVEMRTQGVSNSMNMIFNDFYLAATSNEKIHPYSVSYRKFAQKMDDLFAQRGQAR